MTKTVLLWDRTVLSHIFVAVTCHTYFGSFLDTSRK